MTIEEEAARWAVRIDRGLSVPEGGLLDRWLAEDVRHRGALLRARAAWGVLDRARALGVGEDADGRDIAALDRRRLIGLGGGIAALLIAGVGWRFAGRGDAYLTGTGEIRRLALADGSLALVNSESGVRVSYRRRSRDLELSHGEAWFQVVKNKARPFTVTAGTVRVEAVGTAFDVRRREGASEIVVTEGVVRIWQRGLPQPIRLAANQRAVIGDRTGDVRLAALTAEQSSDQLAWREGRIVLDEVTLAEAMSEFNRYNRVKLAVAPALAEHRIVGSFHIDDLEGFVRACAILTNARVERREGSLTLHE